MKHLNTQLEEEFSLFEKYNLSPNELFFVKNLFLALEEDDRGPLTRFFNIPEAVRGSVRSMLLSLQDKGIILKSYKVPQQGEAFVVEDVEFSKNFLNNFAKCSFELGKDLMEHYPISTVINGVEYKLRRISKKFDSPEDAYRAYGKYIRWNPEKHKHVIELIEIAKENGYNFTTLDDFIVDNDWNNIEAMELEGLLNTSGNKLL